jgi:hypothetical protein
MIISISGRKLSGKTTLANEAIKRGFVKISFADKLKRITSELIDCPIEDLSDPIKKEEKFNKPYHWIDLKDKLEKTLNLSLPDDIQNILLESKRDVLQFIGTEVLRRIDSEYHVNSLKEQIEPNKNYVTDDCRFLNEFQLLSSLGAVSILVIRPSHMVYSNHESETALNRKYFKKIIKNNQSKEKFIEMFNRFLDNKTDLEGTISSRTGGPLDDFFLNENQESCYASGVLYACSSIVNQNKCDLIAFNTKINIPKPIDLFSLYGDQRIIDNEIYLDDFKRWNILKENKDMNSYPEILENKEDLKEYWKKGVKDGLSSKTNH